MNENKTMIKIHNHTDASNARLIDCCIKTKDLIYKAVELGDKGVAITDHEILSNHVKALQVVADGKKKGTIPEDFKLILGNEIYLVDSLEDVRDNYQSGVTKFYHFILLAKDEIGHRQLRELSSLAWDNSFHTGGMERVPTVKADLARVIGENRGHIIASTACIGGELGQNFIAMNKAKTEAEKEFYRNRVRNYIAYCLDVFGEDFYLELQPSTNEEQCIVNVDIIELAKACGIKHIITTDSHYLTADDREIHRAYLNSKDEEREVADFYETTYMMPVDELCNYFPYLDEENVIAGLDNTLEIGSKIENYDLYHPTIVPMADIPDFELQHLFEPRYEVYEYLKKYAYSDDVNDRYLLKLIEDGFLEKIPYSAMSKESFELNVERIAIELEEMWKVTEKIHTSISSYYLTTLELIEIMWNEGDSLVGIARGSVTGMFTMYLIGITQMNPIPWGLPHWRHISAQKAELSDVDIDTQANRRQQIIDAVKVKKGERKVLNCCTFKTEGSKSAIQTAGRGLGYDIDITSYIANMVPVTRGFTWSLHDCIYGNEEEERKPVQGFKAECDKYEGLLDVALGIEGLINGRSIHASAVYLFNEDFLEHNARMKAPNGQYTTQFNMSDSDYMSALKMD